MPGLGATPKTKDGAVDLYDKWADTYDETLRSWNYPAPGRITELLKQHRGDDAPALPVLDAGCGTGLVGEALKASGFAEIVGTDVSNESLKLVVKNKPGLYKSVACCDLECSEGPLPFADKSFSAVVCVGVLSYVQKFDVVFKEWCRVTAPGGLVIFTHREPFWTADEHSCRSVAAALEGSGGWKQLLCSEPSDYMPSNPDPAESSKKIRYVVYKVVA
mmetsp:Transcript_3974/g.10765  ORF Transcript_3974/g.10765 Transcript_3974/m.10765 type:complete len:218 (-) Transcript_3974:38-691(-)